MEAPPNRPVSKSKSPPPPVAAICEGLADCIEPQQFSSLFSLLASHFAACAAWIAVAVSVCLFSMTSTFGAAMASAAKAKMVTMVNFIMRYRDGPLDRKYLQVFSRWLETERQYEWCYLKERKYWNEGYVIYQYSGPRSLDTNCCTCEFGYSSVYRNKYNHESIQTSVLPAQDFQLGT